MASTSLFGRGHLIRSYFSIAMLLTFVALYSNTFTFGSGRPGPVSSARFRRDYIYRNTSLVNSKVSDPPLTLAQFSDWAVKGCRLISYMEERSMDVLFQTMSAAGLLTPEQLEAGTADSVFTNYADLPLNGWERTADNAATFISWIDDETPGAVPFFRAMDFSTGLRSGITFGFVNAYVRWHQNGRWYNGRDHTPTEGSYEIVYNTLNGIILRQNIASPMWVRNFEYPMWQNDPSLALPALRLVSDVAALEYAAECTRRGNDAHNFKYSIDDGIVNSATLGIIDIILARRGFTERWPADNDLRQDHLMAPEWDQRVILDRTNPADAENFQALLASPNARGTAWMLIQHSVLFGHKRVKSLTIFKGPGPELYTPELLTEVEDVPLGPGA